MRNLILKTAAWRQTHGEEGQGVIEYGLVVALVSLALALLLFGLGEDVMTAVGTKIGGSLPLS